MKRLPFLVVVLVTAALLAGLYVGLRSPAAHLEPGPRSYTLAVRGLRVVSGPTVLAAVQGDPVTIAVTSDRPGMVYVHGYEQMVDVVPEEPATLSFTARYAGRYGLHIHATDNTHTEVAAIEVQPR